jgi:glycosyltransferase involved in cell wall biosynthesis
LLGLPIIATYVGGVPSLVVDGETGLLVPANEPFMLAERIREIFGNPSQAEYLGRNAAISAEKRHEPKAILRDLLDAYNAIMD